MDNLRGILYKDTPNFVQKVMLVYVKYILLRLLL